MEHESLEHNAGEAVNRDAGVERQRQVQEDINRLRMSIERNEETERLYLSKDMSLLIRSDPEYANELKRTAPDLYERVANYDIDPVYHIRVPFAENLRRAVQGSSEELYVGEIAESETGKAIDELEVAADEIAEASHFVDAGPAVSAKIVQPAASVISLGEAIAEPTVRSPQTRLIHRAFIKDETGNVRRLGEDKVALRDLGSKIRVLDKQRDAFQAAIEIAEEKGWKAIQVRGSPKFRAEAWFHAQLRGVGVEGYEPTEADRERLAHAQERESAVQVSTELRESAEEAKTLALAAGHGLQDAETGQGRYAGKVLGETDHHVVQSIGRNVAVLHAKAALGNGDRLPDGELNISYANGKASVKAKELTRAGRER